MATASILERPLDTAPRSHLPESPFDGPRNAKTVQQSRSAGRADGKSFLCRFLYAGSYRVQTIRNFPVHPFVQLTSHQVQFHPSPHQGFDNAIIDTPGGFDPFRD